MTADRDRRWLLGLAAGVGAVWWLQVIRPAPPEPPSFGSSDLFGYYLPAYEYVRERLRAGSLPWWNPYAGAGAPFVAMLQPGALYPARLLLLALDAPAAMHLSLLAHVVLAAVGTFALCRALGAGRLAALAGATVFAVPGTLSYVFYPSFLEGGAWLPVAGLGLVRTVQGRGLGWAVLLGVALGMPVLAGGHQTSVYVAYGIAVLAAALLAGGDRRLPWSTLAGRVVIAGLVTVALVAPQLLMTVAWTGEASRSPAPLTDNRIQPYWIPPLTATLAARVIRQAVIPEPGLQMLHYSLPAVLLALVGAVAGGRRGAMLGLGTLLFWLLTLGPGTPWFFLYHWLPGLGWFRIPQRLAVLVAFLGALGVARGLTAIGGAPSRWRRAGEAVAAAAVVLALVLPARNELSLPWTTPPELRVRGAPVFFQASRLAEGGRLSVPGDTVALGFGAFARLGMGRRVAVLQDYEPLSSRRLGAYLHALADIPPPAPEALPFLGFVRGDRVRRATLLDVAAVTGLVVDRRLALPRREPPFEPVLERGDFRVLRNPGALPRAYLVARARFVAGEEDALDAIVAPGFDPRTDVVLVGAPDGAGEHAMSTVTPVRAQAQPIVHDAPERVAVAVEASAPAILVLADAFAPGWTVDLDGVPRRLRQANYLMRGVIVGPGDRQAVFSYEPPGRRAGVRVSLAALAAAALLAGISRRRRSDRRQGRAPGDVVPAR